MNQIKLKHIRILALAPTTRGVGFAVIDEQGTLADQGVKTIKSGDKNAQSLKKVKELIADYEPGVLVLQDTSVKGSRRAPRIQKLTKQIIKLAETDKIEVKLFSNDQVMNLLIPDGQGTKHERAKIIADRFPEQLAHYLPPKRRPWESERHQMDIFDAVALALAFRMKQAKR